MAGGKWGESFLKSGFPLEHLVLVIFKNLQWDCHPNFEYTRLNREKHEEWFEVDLVAKCPRFNETTQLSMLLECKYHDPSRYWFFLPHESSGRWLFDDRALNCAPYQTLRHPRANTILREAPLSSHAIVVAQDGAKQDNAAHTAIQQVVNGFVPCALDWAFGYNIDYTNVMDPRDELRFEPGVDALIPVVVTNADLFRLRPEIKDLDVIRKASGPPDVAESVGWTWCYHDVPSRLADQNMEAIRRHLRKVPELVYRFPDISNGISRPSAKLDRCRERPLTRGVYQEHHDCIHRG